MSYSKDKARELVLKAGLELCEAGLVARTWGNISARVSDTQYVITPSGRAYDTLSKEDIVLVNIADGTYIGDVKPSGEKGVHAAVYEQCPEINFVIHTHQNYASALSVLESVIFVAEDKNFRENIAASKESTDTKKDVKSILGSVIPCAGYGMYATERLVNNIKDQIKTHPDSKAILMKYHGTLCFGADYDEAFAVAYELEKVSRKVFDELCIKGSADAEAENLEASKITEDGNGEVVNEKTKQTFIIPSELKEILDERDGIKSVMHTNTPFIMKMSNLGKTMYPYLDDMAQIAGVDVKCVSLAKSENAYDNSTDISKTGTENIWTDALIAEVTEALQERNAVFVKGCGAICTGFDDSEAEAVAIVLEKACMAAYLAECVGNLPPLDAESARLDREGYVNHYSKLK